ncbi:F-box/WD repeat-containing protein 7-like isoform X2 [Entelurus aequoreus]|uniref:F-box/WD repeat-containing protein 7-like isoform X2 n=1 Tax=Entelurus aequoreus TaxID=161455 RepID=UPI002B1E6E0F|nr:F-box/WD repeat-containing protein 7-like isoform X2 [Entelurus aequoreus]
MGFYGTLKLIFFKMKRKLDHGPDGRTFSSGKKHCKGKGHFSPSSLVQATPTTFGDLRLANGHSAQRRRVTSGPPPSGLQDWLHTFQAWSGPERLLALDELIDRCETGQVKHMMQVIEPQFQRDFISLLPKELALYVLTFLAPRDLLQAAQTCRYWRTLAEDNLLWREKCHEEGISERSPPRRRKCEVVSVWKSTYIRQHRIENNWKKGDTRKAKELKGHDDHVITCLQFSGDLIISGSDDNTLKVWSAVTGKCLRTLTGHTGGVWCSQMAGATVISGSTDRTLRVWNAESGDCVHTLYGHTSTVRCMHLHGNRVVSGSRDTTLRVWDVTTGRCEHVLTGHVAAVRCVQYDGRRVVSGGYDYMVKVWDPESEACLHTLQGHTNRVYSLQFDGAFVVSGSLDTSIRVWDVETGGCVHTLTGHQSLTSGMELRDHILVSGNADSTVRVWDIRTGQCLHTLQGPNKHQSAVTCLQFCRDLVLSSSDDGTVKLWDLRTGAWLRDVVALQSRQSGGVVWRIKASDTRLVCAAGSRNGTEGTKLLVLDFDLDDRQTDPKKQTESDKDDGKEDIIY